MAAQLRHVRSPSYQNGWKGRNVQAELRDMLQKSSTDAEKKATRELHTTLWGCNAVDRGKCIELEVPTTNRQEFIVVTVPASDLPGHGSETDPPSSNDVLQAARNSKCGLIKRIHPQFDTSSESTVFQMPRPAADCGTDIQSVCIVLARADGELHREVKLCDVQKTTPGVVVKYLCEDSSNGESQSCDVRLSVERAKSATETVSELVVYLYLFPSAASSVCDSIISSKDVTSAKLHCSCKKQVFLSQTATAAEIVLADLPRNRAFQIISFAYDDHGVVVGNPSRTIVRTAATWSHSLSTGSPVKSAKSKSSAPSPTRSHRSGVDMLYGDSIDDGSIFVKPVTPQVPIPTPKSSSSEPSTNVTTSAAPESLNSIRAREGSVATSLLDKTGFLKVSVVLTKRPFTQELVRALRRIFHSELTSTWVGTEKLRPCDIRPRQKITVASYGTSAFIKFMESYTEAVTLVNYHAACSEERKVKVRSLQSQNRRNGKPSDGYCQLVPIRATEMVTVLSLLTGKKAPWEVEWFTFLLLTSLDEATIEQFLVPFRSVFDKCCIPHPPTDEVEFYQLIRNLNGGDHLPLDSLWKVFFADNPTFSEAILALFPRVQQIAIIGRCTEVHPNIHLQAYERAIKKKVRMGFRLLVQTDISVLRRYFTLILSSALQAKSRRLTQYRGSLEMTRGNQIKLYRRYFDILLAHHRWCHEYHDRVQKSKALMWRTNAGLATSYWAKLKMSVQINRKRKIFGYKLEKIRITQERDMLTSKVLHRKYFRRWVKWFLTRQHILLLQYLLRDVRIGLTKVYFCKLLLWIRRHCSKRHTERLKTLIANTNHHNMLYCYRNLRDYPLLKIGFPKQLQSDDFLLNHGAEFMTSTEREIELQLAIQQERKYAVFLIESWWRFVRNETFRKQERAARIQAGQ